MQHKAAFHHGLHRLLRKNGSSETEIQYVLEESSVLEIITIYHSIYSMDHPTLLYVAAMDNFIVLKRGKHWANVSEIGVSTQKQSSGLVARENSTF